MDLNILTIEDFKKYWEQSVRVGFRVSVSVRVRTELTYAASTCCSPVTTLCRFQCGVAEVCTLSTAVRVS